jgi:hypothetical protein
MNETLIEDLPAEDAGQIEPGRSTEECFQIYWEERGLSGPPSQEFKDEVWAEVEPYAKELQIGDSIARNRNHMIDLAILEVRVLTKESVVSSFKLAVADLARDYNSDIAQIAGRIFWSGIYPALDRDSLHCMSVLLASKIVDRSRDFPRHADYENRLKRLFVSVKACFGNAEPALHLIELEEKGLFRARTPGAGRRYGPPTSDKRSSSRTTTSRCPFCGCAGGQQLIAPDDSAVSSAAASPRAISKI